MNSPQELEQVREFFVKDRFTTDNGVTIEEVDDRYAKCSSEIQPYHLNAANTVTGGVIFTLADSAFAVTFGWNKPLHVSTTLRITYLGVVKGSRLIAQVYRVKEGRNTCYYPVEVTDGLGSVVAHATASGLSKG